MKKLGIATSVKKTGVPLPAPIYQNSTFGLRTAEESAAAFIDVRTLICHPPSTTH